MIIIHLSALVFSVMVMLYADKQAFSWILGKTEKLDEKKLNRTHLAMWLGLGTMIASGVTMLAPQWSYLSKEPLFMMKMLFVAILVTNGVLIGRLVTVATTRTFASLSIKEKVPLFASAIFSLIGWIGAFTMAKILF